MAWRWRRALEAIAPPSATPLYDLLPLGGLLRAGVHADDAAISLNRMGEEHGEGNRRLGWLPAKEATENLAFIGSKGPPELRLLQAAHFARAPPGLEEERVL